MNKLTTMFPMTILSLTALTAYAEPIKHQDMYKQLDIMTSIIKSTVSQNSSNHQAQLSNIESTYLRGQGVVFIISARAKSHQWGNFSFAIPEPPIATIAPVIEIDETYDEDFTEDMAENIEYAAKNYEKAIESLMEERHGYHKLKEKQRDLTYDIREVERETRDIEFQLKRATGESKNELEQALKKLKLHADKLEMIEAGLKEKTAELEEKKNAKAKKVKQERTEYYQQLTTTLAETFCLYGNGLKALPESEKISVILKGAGEQQGRRYTDQIIVFDKRDVLDCAIDKISASKLIENGASYHF